MAINVKVPWSLKCSYLYINFISLYQMKLLNTAPNMDNFSVIIHTVGLNCHHEDLFIYGHQDVEENQGGQINNENLHFIGTFSKFELVKAEIIDGSNRCVFKPVASGFSPYIFVAVIQIPKSGTCKICEVEFA